MPEYRVFLSRKNLDGRQAFDFNNDGIARVGEFLLNALDVTPPSVETARRRKPLSRPPIEKATLLPTAILFMDIAKSTKLFEDHGDEVANRILGKTIRDWEKLTEKNYGWVIKTIGDEIMVAFENADDCVMAATEIREEIAIGLRGESIKIQVKMGLSFGEARRMPDNDIFGHAVNVAARMTGTASAGQIITDAATVESLAPELQSRCTKLGETRVKGIDEAISYYANL